MDTRWLPWPSLGQVIYFWLGWTRHDGNELQALEPVPLCQGHVWEGAPPEEVGSLSEPEGMTEPFLGPCSPLLLGSSFSGSVPGSSSSHMEAEPVFILSPLSQAFPPHSCTLQGYGWGVNLTPWRSCPDIQIPSLVSTLARAGLTPPPQGVTTAPQSLGNGGLSTSL